MRPLRSLHETNPPARSVRAHSPVV